MSTVETKPATGAEPLILTETDGHVGIIRLNRPKALNAINPEMIEQVVRYQLHGTTDLEFDEPGVRCTLRIPLWTAPTDPVDDATSPQGGESR